MSKERKRLASRLFRQDELIDDELEHHLAERIDRLVAGGMAPDEARVVALQRFGDLNKWKRELASIASRRSLRAWLASVASDFRFALRQFRRNPAFATTATATLALGIGASTAIFGVVKAVVLDPLPYAEADRLVELNEVTPSGVLFSVARSNYLSYAQRTESFASLAASTRADFAMMTDEGPVNVVANEVTPSYFDVLGVTPAAGRTFLEDEGGADPAPVAVVSSETARRYLDGDPIGAVMTLDGNAHTVVGVMPDEMSDPADADVWVPLLVSETQSRSNHDVAVLGRLADGVSIERAHAEALTVAATLGSEFPETNGGWGVRLVPLKESLIGASRIQAGWMLLGAVGLLLALACGSVANLLIARASTRRQEMGLRVAIGAPRGRLLQQLTVESLSLAALAGVLGLGIAFLVVPVIQAVSPADTPRLDNANVTGGVVAFTVGVSVLTGLLFGLLPAFSRKGADAQALRSGTRTTSRAGEGLRRTLVAGQVAATVTLLVGAVLLGSSFLRMQQRDVGLELASTRVIPLMLSGDRYTTEQRRVATDAMRARLEVLPGVQSAGYSNVRPFSGMNTSIDVTVEGEPTTPEEAPSVAWRLAGPGYFETAGLEGQAGRLFEPHDYEDDAEQVVVLTRELARSLFGTSQAAVGRRIAMGWNGTNWRTVVGVIEDFQDTRVSEEPALAFFMPATGGWAWTNFLVRGSSAEAMPSSQAIRDAIWSVDPTLPVPLIQPLAESHAAAIAGPRFNLTIIATFGVVALLLSVMGVYGVTLFAVSRRTQEIGVRLALGASPRSVVHMLLGQGFKLALLGIGAGLLLSVFLARYAEGLLFETPARDPQGLALAAGVCLGAVMVATLVPALRATRIDPTRALAND